MDAVRQGKMTSEDKERMTSDRDEGWRQRRRRRINTSDRGECRPRKRRMTSEDEEERMPSDRRGRRCRRRRRGGRPNEEGDVRGGGE